MAEKSSRALAYPTRKPDQEFLTGTVRGFGGALLFSLPILLTMEMWWLGFYAYRWRLFILALIAIPVLIVLARLSGLRKTTSWSESAFEGITAYGIGIMTTIAVLLLLNIISVEMQPEEIFGKVAALAPAAAFGAIIARSELGQGNEATAEQEEFRSAYWAELFMVGAGAFYLAGTVATTQEMILIAFKMTPWYILALAVFEVLTMHAIIYWMNFRGTPMETGRHPAWRLFVHYTIPGYVIALLVSAYLLWTFGRFDSYSLHWMVFYTVVLGLPASIGGAAGRLVI